MADVVTPDQARRALGADEVERRRHMLCVDANGRDCFEPGHICHDLTFEQIAWMFGVTPDVIQQWHDERLGPFA
jgi:hypothetical protein